MDPLQITGWIGAAAAVAGLVGWAVRTLWLAARRIGDLHDDWRGEPDRPGVPGRRGVMERLRNIEGELTVNGGKSLKDRLIGMDQRLSRVEQALAATTTSPPVQVNVNPAPPMQSPQYADGGTT